MSSDFDEMLKNEVKQAVLAMEKDNNYQILCDIQDDSSDDDSFAIEWAKSAIKAAVIEMVISARLYPNQAPMVTQESLRIIGELRDEHKKEKKMPSLRIVKNDD